MLALAGAGVLLQLAVGGRYGYFRDELYYLDCARHLGWGYVDQPPLSLALLAAWRAIAGESLLALHALPALALGALVAQTSRLAGDLGAGPFGRVAAAVGALACPLFLAVTDFYSMNAFDVLFWVVALRLVARLLAGGDPRLWLALGAVGGLGLQNKISVLFLAAALALAFLVTPERRRLATRWPWLGAAVAALIFLPHVAWQIAHGWPTVEFVLNAKRQKIAALGVGGFARAQLTIMGPLNWLLYAPGLAWLLLARSAARWRALGWLFVAAFLLLALQRSKPYYLGPAYLTLLAGGACALEAWTAGRVKAWARPAALALLLAGGAIGAPLVMPVLPPERLVAYSRAVGLSLPAEERGRQAELPQILADRFGWQELARAVADAWRSLPEADRARAGIVADNYGEAGALNLFGPRLGLPRAASGHNSCYLWGPPEHTEIILAVGFDPDDLRQSFESVTPAGRRIAPWAMPSERDLTVYVCRGWKIPPEEGWRRARHFI